MAFKGLLLTQEEFEAIDLDSQAAMNPGDTANCPHCAAELTALERMDGEHAIFPVPGELVVQCGEDTYLVAIRGKSLQ